MEEPSARSDEIGKALQEESKTESLGTGVWGIGLWKAGGKWEIAQTISS